MNKVQFDDPLTDKIISCIIKVHRALGPGFVERIYLRALLLELRKRHLEVDAEKAIEIYYDNELVGRHRLDLVVQNKVVLELKAVRQLHPVHYSQLRSYLKAALLQTGILVNFSTERADYRRITLFPR